MKSTTFCGIISKKVGGVFKIKFLLRLIDIFKTLFLRRERIIFNLEEEYADVILHKKDIENKNVLIGTVRRKEQLSQNLRHTFYHIPLDQLIDEAGIEFVALYQSINLFSNSDEDTGIINYAKVKTVSRVKRDEILEISNVSAANKLYVRFDFDKWEKLPERIYIREKSPKVFHKTSMYLFKRARYTYELYFDTVDEYIIYCGLKDLLSDIYDGFIYKDIKIEMARKHFIILYRGEKSKLSVKDFRSSPIASLKKIIK